MLAMGAVARGQGEEVAAKVTGGGNLCQGNGLVLLARCMSSLNTARALASNSFSEPSLSITYWLRARLRSASICDAIMRSASSFDRPRSARSRARRTGWAASMIVAPQRRSHDTTVDLPAAMLPVRATLSMGERRQTSDIRRQQPTDV